MGRSRGGGGMRAPAMPRAPSPPPSRRPITTAPVRPQAPVAAPPRAGTKQPGLFGQMAATAGGVAIGSAVGHAVGSAITGGSGGGGYSEPVQQIPPEQMLQENLEVSGPCAFEIKQFLSCATAQRDLSLCQAFSDAVRDCKFRNNIPWGVDTHLNCCIKLSKFSK